MTRQGRAARTVGVLEVSSAPEPKGHLSDLALHILVCNQNVNPGEAVRLSPDAWARIVALAKAELGKGL